MYNTSSKEFCWKLVETFVPETGNHSLQLWQFDPKSSLTNEDLVDLLLTFFKIVKASKLCNFQFRLINRILTTNTLRNKWNKQISPFCYYCKITKETVLHLLVECPFVERCWKNLTKWLNYFLECNIDFTPQLIIYNNYKGKHMELINLFIIVMKQYVYATKCMGTNLNFQEYIEKINYWFKIECCYAIKTIITPDLQKSGKVMSICKYVICTA